MIRLVRCCFVGCSERVDWEDDDSVIADWLLFHPMLTNQILSAWLCPEHAERYGWKNVDLRKVKGGEPSPEEREIIANSLEALLREDPEAFDPEKLNILNTLEAMRVRRWSITATSIAIHDA